MPSAILSDSTQSSASCVTVIEFCAICTAVIALSAIKVPDTAFVAICTAVIALSAISVPCMALTETKLPVTVVNAMLYCW